MSLRQFAWLLILYYFLYNKQRKTLYLRLKSHQIYISMNSDMMSDNKKVASDTPQRYLFPHALSTTVCQIHLNTRAVIHFFCWSFNILTPFRPFPSTSSPITFA